MRPSIGRFGSLRAATEEPDERAKLEPKLGRPFGVIINLLPAHAHAATSAQPAPPTGRQTLGSAALRAPPLESGARKSAACWLPGRLGSSWNWKTRAPLGRRASSAAGERLPPVACSNFNQRQSFASAETASRAPRRSGPQSGRTSVSGTASLGRQFGTPVWHSSSTAV